MRFQVASDLHLEFHPDGGKALLDGMMGADVDGIIIAGDVSTGDLLMPHLCDIASRWDRVIYVPGNHEYYYSSFPVITRRFRDLPGNVTLLDNDIADIGGVRFLGGTMWFPPYREDGSKSFINDFALIKDIDIAVGKNREFTQLLIDEMTPDTVVVSHHLPLIDSVPDRFWGSSLNQFFLSDMERFLVDGSRRPRLWVHGHTHDSCDYRWEGMRVLCNPFGYAGAEANAGFDPLLVIDI